MTEIFTGRRQRGAVHGRIEGPLGSTDEECDILAIPRSIQDTKSCAPGVEQ